MSREDSGDFLETSENSEVLERFQHYQDLEKKSNSFPETLKRIGGVKGVSRASPQTAASHVIQKLGQHCQIFSTNAGRVYRPKGAERLILYQSDLSAEGARYTALASLPFGDQIEPATDP